MRLTRHHALALLLAAALLVVAVGPWAGPLLVVASLLLTGRYVGEERILASRLARLAPVRAIRTRWSRRHTLALVRCWSALPRARSAVRPRTR